MIERIWEPPNKQPRSGYICFCSGMVSVSVGWGIGGKEVLDQARKRHGNFWRMEDRLINQSGCLQKTLRT